MSNASSNQSFVRDGSGYKELYPSGCRDPDELSERSPFAASPSSKNEDMELAEPEEGSDDDDQKIKSVVGADGLREFVMLPEWTVHNFTSTIKAFLQDFSSALPYSLLGPYFIRSSTQMMGSTFFWPMEMDPLGPSGLASCFYPLQTIKKQI